LHRTNLWGTTRDIAAIGGERSTLDHPFRRAAVREGLTATGDPRPQAGEFFESDLIVLARAGVPAIGIRSGASFVDRPPGWGADQERRFVANRYRQPGDEMRDDFSFAGAVQQIRLMIRLAWELAGGDDFPTWVPTSEFRPAGERLRIRRAQGGGS
jgi:hypothetical protein